MAPEFSTDLPPHVPTPPTTAASAGSESLAAASTGLARVLTELIAALDRRVPHVERAGEADIARDAAALREKAVQRLREIEELRAARSPG